MIPNICFSFPDRNIVFVRYLGFWGIGGISPDISLFCHEYLDDGGCDFSYYSYGKYLFLVGDFKPNSNGWTCRFPLYRKTPMILR